MKQLLIATAMIISCGLLAQPHVAMYVQDAKGNPVKSQDVKSVALFILGPDSLRDIHFEKFDLFTIQNGLVYLEIGHGTTSVDYCTSIKNYFNSFPIDKRPEAGENLVVKIELRMANGESIEGYQTLFVNAADPLIKGNGDQTSFLSGNEFFMHNGSQFSYIQPGSIKLNNNDYQFDFNSPNGIKLTDNVKKETSLYGAGIIQTIDEAAVEVWKIWNDGFDFTPESEKKVQLNKDGMNFKDIKNDYKLSLDFNKFSFTKNNFGWEFTPSGGSFKTNKDKSINFNNNMMDITDSVSKRQSRLIPNGLINMFDAKNIIGIGVTSLGNPQVIYNRPNGTITYSSSINEDGGMDQSFFNKNGNVTFRATTLSGTNGDNPFVYITKDGGAPGAGMFYSSQGVATLFATVKNFRMDHPDLPDKDIIYASLEGPEAAAYCRGRGKLEKGKAFIPFPDHFKYVCSPENTTVQLTPLSANSEGLAVTSVTPEGFQIVELHKGTGDYGFYWEVKSIRKGFENYQVIRPKSDLAPVEFNTKSLQKN